MAIIYVLGGTRNRKLLPKVPPEEQACFYNEIRYNYNDISEGNVMYKLNTLIPELSVSDINKSLYFYLNILSFKLEYERKEDKFAMDPDGYLLRFAENLGAKECNRAES